MASVSGPAIRTGLSDAALADEVARATLGYFTDFAHPVSGMARERSAGAFGYDTGEVVTTGGTGFGIMAILAGAERGWVPAEEARERIGRIVGFLARAERHRGVFPHFLHGTTGATVPFSPADDGGDLVETSFLAMGLLAARQYLAGDTALAAEIDRLWREIEWSAHLRAGGDLMWHRSDRHPWTAKSLPIRGWNECLVTYVLAAASPTHPVPPEVYHRCWAGGEEFRNGREYHGIRLPLGPEAGGPLFLSHYSFLGIDPRGLADAYADYGEQVVAHARINHAHCLANPHGHAGYGPDCWGLTASDSPGGYAAHSPTNDLGVITPTAAVASMPWVPEEATRAMRHFHDRLGDRLWRRHGFADAFHPGSGWVADSQLAIDQGPIVVMLENHRSGLLWELFMGAPEVRHALAALGFRGPRLDAPST